MRARSARGMTAKLVGLLAVVASLFAATVVVAPQASAAGTFANPGEWVFNAQAGRLILAGRGSPLQPPTRPYQCDNGTNDDASLVDPNMPPVYQDAFPDYPEDPECASPTDDSELVPGEQPRAIINAKADVAADGTFTDAEFSFAPIYTYINQPFAGAVSVLTGAPVTAGNVTVAQTNGSGTATASTTTTLTDNTKTWTAGQWVGYRVVIGAQTRNITANTTNQITVSAAFSPAVAVGAAYNIIPGANKLEDNTQSWTPDQWVGYQAVITGGTGVGQSQPIIANTATALTVGSNWGITPNATSTYTIDEVGRTTQVTGNLDPATGQGTLDIEFNAYLSVPVVGWCTITGVTASLSTTNPGGSNYDENTGMLTLIDSTFELPASTGAALCASVNTSFGLPSAPGVSILEAVARATKVSGNQDPTAIAPATPVGVLEGDEITLTPSATDPDEVLCQVAPCPTPPPTYNWRWTQTGGPTIPHIDVEPISGAATFIVPDEGNYSFVIEVGDGSGPNLSPNDATLNFSAGGVAPTIDAGPDLTVSAGLASGSNPQKLVGKFTSPAPSDVAGRIYSWTTAPAGPGNTCSPAAAVTVTSPASLTSTFSTAGVAADCFVDVTLTGTDEDGASGNDTTRVFVKATAAGTISGTVTGCTPACSPLGGAVVTLFEVDGASLVNVDFTVADLDGTYSFSGLNPAETYKLRFNSTGFTQAWLGGANVAQNSPALPVPYAGADQTIYGGANGRGTISGAVTTEPSGNAPDGTSVRLYGADGRFIRSSTVTGGSYSFTQLPPGGYKVAFAMGVESPVDYAMVWTGGALNPSTAAVVNVTGGSTTTADASLVRDSVAPKSTGTATAAAAGSITDSTKSWTNNQWVGHRARIVSGAGAGQSQPITGNTATSLTISPTFAVAPAAGSVYVIELAATNSLPGTGLCTGLPCAANAPLFGAPAPPYIQDTTKNWTPDMWAGYRVRIVAGRGVGQVKTIIGNTNVRLNVTGDWGTGTGVTATSSVPDATSVYSIELATDDQPASLQGGVNYAATGAKVPDGQTEVRVYNAGTGSFIGKVAVGANLAGLVPAFNYSFARWTADPAFPLAQAGLPPGSYLVLFRVLGTGGASPALCSEWNADVVGGPNTGSFAFADPITLEAGSTTNLLGSLSQNAGCVSRN
jgi:hypothetical protein